MSKFNVTYSNKAARESTFRPDLHEPPQRNLFIENQEAIRRANLAKDSGAFMSKEAHRKMLCALIGEIHRHHRENTGLYVCRMGTKGKGRTGGLSKKTMEALVTDVSIVMQDPEKDNYAHALNSIASLTLWRA